MSSPIRPRPPAEVSRSAVCMCATGGACSTFGRGHALHLIQARLAAATPSDWVDAVVETVRGAEISVRTLDGARIELWHAAGTEAAPGEPVAVHARYGVLSVRGALRNVAVLAGVSSPPSSTP